MDFDCQTVCDDREGQQGPADLGMHLTDKGGRGFDALANGCVLNGSVKAYFGAHSGRHNSIWSI